VEGKTVTFGIDYSQGSDATALAFQPIGSEQVTGSPGEIGLEVQYRIGGVNTGYHIEEGILLAAGAGVPSDPSRKEVDVLDVTPSLLANVLGVEPAPSMQGIPTLFA
jgi:hypothetical protein